MVEKGATKPYESAQVHQRQGICRVRGRGRAPPDADWAPHRWRQPFQARCTIYGGVHRFLPPIREKRYAILHRPWGGYQFGGRKLCGGYQLCPWQTSVLSAETFPLFVAYLPSGSLCACNSNETCNIERLR